MAKKKVLAPRKKAAKKVKGFSKKDLKVGQWVKFRSNREQDEAFPVGVIEDFPSYLGNKAVVRYIDNQYGEKPTIITNVDMCTENVDMKDILEVMPKTFKPLFVYREVAGNEVYAVPGLGLAGGCSEIKDPIPFLNELLAVLKSKPLPKPKPEKKLVKRR